MYSDLFLKTLARCRNQAKAPHHSSQRAMRMTKQEQNMQTYEQYPEIDLLSSQLRPRVLRLLQSQDASYSYALLL